ncbi:hypothetical protein MKW92_022279 [Papaver armeniacum]|nr:hypothetical protein MKW92_022279 [Papaver armeniacum]
MSAVKDQSSSANGNGAKPRVPYPLRSASKDNPTMTEKSKTSVSKRGRLPNVSQSVSVLDLSGKEKSAKPIRRLSIPSKSSANPLPRPTFAITPISEARMKKATPVSDNSKSAIRRKFDVLSSASYWLLQIKISESAAKHSISVGFFKLALESGCEPLERMRDELKSYARRHNLVGLGEPVKELLKSYKIEEALEQLQVSEACPLVPEGTQSSNEDRRSSTSAAGARKSKPASTKSESTQVSPVAGSAKKENSQKIPSSGNRLSLTKKSMNVKPDAAARASIEQKKKPQRPIKLEVKIEKVKPKSPGKKVLPKKDSVDSLPAEESLEVTQQEDKENMDALQLEEIDSSQ